VLLLLLHGSCESVPLRREKFLAQKSRRFGTLSLHVRLAAHFLRVAPEGHVIWALGVRSFKKKKPNETVLEIRCVLVLALLIDSL
jgi:hypothetical protein